VTLLQFSRPDGWVWPSKVRSLSVLSAGQPTSVSTEHLSIRELTDGLDDVGSVAIPYASLPGRARSAFSAQFVYWSDIAGETVQSLLRTPKAGKVTVRAMLLAAEEAVARGRADRESRGPESAAAVVQRLLDQLDDRDRVMLSARVYAEQPRPLKMVAEQLGVSAGWVHRNQRRVRARFAELLADPAHREVVRRASELGDRLGTYVPRQFVDEQLRGAGIDPEGEAARVLLFLAGPYMRTDNWYEATARGGRQQVAAAVSAAFDHCVVVSTGQLAEAATASGLVADVVGAYLDSDVSVRRIGEVWVRWNTTVADKVEAVLHVLGVPSAVEDIVNVFGDEISAGAVQDRLYTDDRFARASRTTWGLRSWGFHIYSGVSDEIAVRIDAAGGSIEVEALISDVLTHVPDVDEGSVKANLRTLAFVTESGSVRRRTTADEWPRIEPVRAVRGAFRSADNEIRLVFTVTAEVLRGSSRAIPAAVASAVGAGPGGQRMLQSRFGEVSVTWPLSSTSGPRIGSLRALVLAADAALDDTVVLIFALDAGSLDATRIDAAAAATDRLGALLGRTVTEPVAALAASLDCRRDHVVAVLRARGDQELADVAERALHPARS
jgi:hypothetical protein